MKIRNLIFIFFVMILWTSCGKDSEKEIQRALMKQLELYPKSTLQDIYKHFYQDYFGPEHAISDTASARRYLQNELNTFSSSNNPMIEELGYRNNFVRINLDAVKNEIITEDDLFHAFIESTDFKSDDQWVMEWKQILTIIKKTNISISNLEQDEFKIDSILQLYPNAALHHSNIFRENYHPHYRIVKTSIYEQRLKKYF